MQQILIYLFLTVFLGLIACKDTNYNSSEETTSPTDSTKINEEGLKTKILYAWVDQLRIRETPDTKAEIVKELQEGEAVTYLNEKTDFTKKVNLRGTLFDEPWLKVRTEDQLEGWLYGGGVRTYRTSVDMVKTPYDKCYSLLSKRKFNKYLECIATTQNRQLRVDKDYATISNNELFLKRLDGQQVHLISSDTAQYQYRYYIPQMGYYVIYTSYHEDGEYRLINDKSGKQTKIMGYPRPSPNYKAVACTNAYLEPNRARKGIQIWAFTPDGFQLVFEHLVKDFLPTTPVWLDDNTLEVNLSPQEHNHELGLQKVRVKLKNGEWQLEK